MNNAKTCELCEWWSDGVCRAGHADIMRKRGMPDWSCPHFVKAVKQTGRQPKIVQSLDIPNLIDVILTKEGTPAYLLLGSEPRLENQIFADDMIMIPPKPRWMCPTEEVLNHIDEEDFNLLEDVENYIFRHVDLPNEDQYSVMATFVPVTWVYDELFDALPFLLFMGPWASGKTRALEVLQRLCWRPMLTSAISEANIFRLADIIRPTLLVDETDLTANDERTRQIVALLRARQKRGVDVSRINPEKRGLESIDWFRVYGPTAISSKRDIPSDLKSRCVVFNMLEKTRPVRKRIDESKGQELRNRLLAFRIRHMNDPKDETHAELDFLEGGRLDELFSPLVRIAKICQRPKAISEAMTEVVGTMKPMTVETKIGQPCIARPWKTRIRPLISEKKIFLRKAVIVKAPKSPIIPTKRRYTA